MDHPERNPNVFYEIGMAHTVGKKVLLITRSSKDIPSDIQHFDYIPFHWIYSYNCYLLDKRDQFYESLEPSLLSYCLSLPAGLWQNLRHMPTYCKEWWRVMSFGGLQRMWDRRRGRADGSAL